MAYTIPYAGGWQNFPNTSTPITAATLNAISNELASYNAAWTSFTPSWANLTVGDGTNEAVYAAIGRTVIIRFALTFGSTTTMTTPFIATPNFRSNIRTSPARVANHIYGYASFRDNSLGVVYPLMVRYNGSNTFGFFALDASSTYATLTGMSATVPVAFAVNDILSGHIIYETAT